MRGCLKTFAQYCRSSVVNLAIYVNYVKIKCIANKFSNYMKVNNLPLLYLRKISTWVICRFLLQLWNTSCYPLVMVTYCLTWPKYGAHVITETCILGLGGCNSCLFPQAIVWWLRRIKRHQTVGRWLEKDQGRCSKTVLEVNHCLQREPTAP